MTPAGKSSSSLHIEEYDFILLILSKISYLALFSCKNYHLTAKYKTEKLIAKRSEKGSTNVLKKYRKNVRRVTSLGRLVDVNFESLVQMHFHCFVINFFPPNVYLKH